MVTPNYLKRMLAYLYFNFNLRTTQNWVTKIFLVEMTSHKNSFLRAFLKFDFEDKNKFYSLKKCYKLATT